MLGAIKRFNSNLSGFKFEASLLCLPMTTAGLAAAVQPVGTALLFARKVLPSLGGAGRAELGSLQSPLPHQQIAGLAAAHREPSAELLQAHPVC